MEKIGEPCAAHLVVESVEDGIDLQKRLVIRSFFVRHTLLAEAVVELHMTDVSL